MARLILLNGAPAVGKSTLARRYAAEHPFTLVLDIDLVRAMLGRWRDDPGRAGLLARAIALAAARTHLDAGLDVVVPQNLGRLTFVEQLAALAASAGAPFQEIMLMDSRDRAARRFVERSRAAVEPVHVDAYATLGPDPGSPAVLAEVGAMYDRLLEVLAARPATRIVSTSECPVEESYAALLAALD